MTMKKASLTALFESNPFEMTSNDDSDDGDHPTGGLIVPILPPPASSPVEDPVDPTEATELAEEPSLKETSCSGDANDATESGTGIAAAEAADPPAPDPENSEPPKKDATSETDCHDDYETTTKRISWAKPSDGTNEHDTDASRDASVPGRESSVDHNYRDFSAIGMMEAKIFTTSTASDDKAKVDTSFPALLHRILSEPAYNNVSCLLIETKTSTTCVFSLHDLTTTILVGRRLSRGGCVSMIELLHRSFCGLSLIIFLHIIYALNTTIVIPTASWPRVGGPRRKPAY